MKKRNDNEKQFSVLMPVDLLQEVDATAKDRDETRAQFIRKALRERLERLNKEKSCNSPSNPIEE